MIDDFGDECRNEVEALRKENADLKHFIAQIPWDALTDIAGDGLVPMKTIVEVKTWMAHARPQKELSE